MAKKHCNVDSNKPGGTTTKAHRWCSCVLGCSIGHSVLVVSQLPTANVDISRKRSTQHNRTNACHRPPPAASKHFFVRTLVRKGKNHHRRRLLSAACKIICQGHKHNPTSKRQQLERQGYKPCLQLRGIPYAEGKNMLTSKRSQTHLTLAEPTRAPSNTALGA